MVRTLLDFTTALKLGNLLHHRTRHTNFFQDNPPALWLMVPPVSLLADLVAVQPVPARASLWAFGWPAARLPERNSETAVVAWYTLKRHGSFGWATLTPLLESRRTDSAVVVTVD